MAKPPSTTVTWMPTSLERDTADGLVTVVHYQVDANDGTYQAGAYGSIGLERGEGELIPYSELTPEIVIGWVKDKLSAESVDNVEKALQTQLDEQRHPTKASGLPWAS